MPVPTLVKETVPKPSLITPSYEVDVLLPPTVNVIIPADELVITPVFNP